MVEWPGRRGQARLHVAQLALHIRFGAIDHLRLWGAALISCVYERLLVPASIITRPWVEPRNVLMIVIPAERSWVLYFKFGMNLIESSFLPVNALSSVSVPSEANQLINLLWR